MRIVHIGPYPVERGKVCGGVEASVFGLVQVQSRNHEVHVFDFPRIEGSEEIGYDEKVLVHRFRNTGRTQMSTSRYVRAIAEEICTLRPDICHIHGTGLFPYLMYRRLRRKKIKVVVTVHGLIRVEKRNVLKKGFTFKRVGQYLYQGTVEKIFLSQLPVAIVDTDYVKERVNKYPIRKKPIMHVVPQGINEAFFSLDCSADSKVLLSVGAIVERKGHLLTLKAFEQYRNMGAQACLVIAGTVASRSYLEQLQKAVRESKFREDIALYTDLSNEELIELYKVAHAFVLHSEEESQGVVLAEAMAVGLPIVSTNVGGIPFVVSHGKNGLLSDYGDIDAFAQNISLLMKDSAMWRDMSEESVAVAHDYHWTNISERVLKIYQTIG